MADHLLTILDDCLALREAGASIDDCLALYPEHAAELAPLLRAVARLQATTTTAPRPEFLADSPARLVRRIQAGKTTPPAIAVPPTAMDGATQPYPSPGSNGHGRPAPTLEVIPPLTNGHRPHQSRTLRRRPRTGWLSLAAALLLVTLLSIGTMNAAAGSLPGDTLYPLKRAGETAWLALPRPLLQQVEARMALAQTRLDEVYRLSERGDTTRAAQALADYQSALLATVQQAEAADLAQALSAAFRVDTQRLRMAHAQGLTWRELTTALSLAARAGGNPDAVLERLAAGETAATILASLRLPPVIIAALPALLGEPPTSPALTPPPQTSTGVATAPTATPSLPHGTPSPGGLVVPTPTPSGPAAALPVETPGSGETREPAAQLTSAPTGQAVASSDNGTAARPAGTASASQSAASLPSTAAPAPSVTQASGADKDRIPGAANRVPLDVPTLSPSGPSLPTLAPPVPTLPAILPTETPALPPLIPTGLPTLPPIPPTAIPTLPPILPTAMPTMPPMVPTAIPTLPPIIPTGLPTLPPVIPTAIPTLPPMIPTALPTLPPLIPTEIPTLAPILPTVPPLVPTELPTLPPVLPTAVPLPTTPPIVPTLRRP